MQEILFYKPTIDDNDIETIKKTLSSQNNTVVHELESYLTKFFGVKHAVSTSSNAATHHLALSAMDVKRGDKFICSVNAFPSIAQAIRHFDAEPILVDIDQDDFNIDPNALKECLEKNHHKKLKGVFVNHVAGQSAMISEIKKIADEYEIQVLDDANEAVGLTYNGEKLAAKESILTCFHIHSQLINPISAAGFMITNNDELAQKAQLLRNHALINGLDKHGNLSYVYDVVDIGLKYDITAISAAFALSQLQKYDAFKRRRQHIAEIYNNELKNVPHISTPIKKRDHTYTQYIIKIDKNRDSFARELLDNGIHTSLHYIPIHLLSYYKNKYNLKVNAYPNALKTYQQVLSLPIYNSLKDEEVMYICDKIKQIAKTRV